MSPSLVKTVQLNYDDGLTIRWENENKIYDYKTIQAIYWKRENTFKRENYKGTTKPQTYRNSPLAENWIRCSCLEFVHSLEK